MKYFDAFAGIGGFTLAITQENDTMCNEEQRVRERARNSEGLRGKRTNLSTNRFACIGYSEIDKYASSIYAKHYPTHHNYGDITKIDAGTLPDFDLLVGGFPCQAFSIAGKRRGFEDTRGTMFFELARILRAKQPRLFIFENVKGLLSHDKGNTFKTIVSTIAELGYDCQWQVLNSKNFGVPQNRERVFIIGHLRGTPRPEVFPIRKANESDKRQITRLKAQSHGHEPMVMLIDTKQESLPRITEVVAALGADDYKEPKNVADGISIRRLTPTECERLQGFPDGWTEGVSDTQRYKCLGNAVTVNVVQYIISQIFS